MNGGKLEVAHKRAKHSDAEQTEEPVDPQRGREKVEMLQQQPLGQNLAQRVLNGLRPSDRPSGLVRLAWLAITMALCGFATILIGIGLGRTETGTAAPGVEEVASATKRQVEPIIIADVAEPGSGFTEAVQSAKLNLTSIAMWELFGSDVRQKSRISDDVLDAAMSFWCNDEWQLRRAAQEYSVDVLRALCVALRPDTVFAQLGERATKGDPAAAAVLSGVLFKHDPRKSLKWAQVAADHGFAAGYYYRGEHYRNGVAIPRDDEMALASYLDAASQDDLRSEGRLCSLLVDFESPKWLGIIFGEPIRVRASLRSNSSGYAWCSFAASNPTSGAGADEVRNEAIRLRNMVVRDASEDAAAGESLVKSWRRKAKALRR